jgi:hypothetical protein
MSFSNLPSVGVMKSKGVLHATHTQQITTRLMQGEIVVIHMKYTTWLQLQLRRI